MMSMVVTMSTHGVERGGEQLLGDGESENEED